MKLITKIVEPKKIDINEYKIIHNIILKYFSLKPGVIFEDDFQILYDECSNADAVLISKDIQGSIQGFYIIKESVFKGKEKKFYVITSDYAFLNKTYRGNTLYMVKGLWYVIKRIVRFLNHQKYFFATVYPASYITLARHSAHCWSLHNDKITENAKLALEKAVIEFCQKSYDEKNRLVNTRIAPKPFKLKDPDNHLHFKNYISQNPQWEEGWALPIIIPINLNTIFAMIRGSLNRLNNNFQFKK